MKQIREENTKTLLALATITGTPFIISEVNF